MTVRGKEVTIDLDEDQPNKAEILPTDLVIEENGEKLDIVDEDAGDTDKLPARARTNGDGSVTLPLLYPVTLLTRKDGKVNEKKFTELTFNRLTGADQRVISGASAEMMAPVAFARSTRVMQAVMNALFDKMDAADIADAGRVLNHFLTNGRPTGR